MRNLIYYPSFEPQNINWLKYAIVYIDDFSPITPIEGQNHVSETFLKIKNETDLIKNHPPDYNQADRASTKTLIEIDNILKFPNQYRDKFNVINIEKELRNSDKWTYDLFNRKFNQDFRDECVRLNLGTESPNGMLTSKELTQLYMTFLAEEICKDRKANPITDSDEFDNLTTYLRNRNALPDNSLSVIQSNLNLQLPQNIYDVNIEKLIHFRNHNEIKELRAKFNASLSNFYKSLENSTENTVDYYKYLEINSEDFFKEIALFFGGITAFSFGASTIIDNPEKSESLKGIIEGVLLTIGGVTSISNAWKINNTKRGARKFLTKISNLR